jgi:hypothetical protein
MTFLVLNLGYFVHILGANVSRKQISLTNKHRLTKAWKFTRIQATSTSQVLQIVISSREVELQTHSSQMQQHSWTNWGQVNTENTGSPVTNQWLRLYDRLCPMGVWLHVDLNQLPASAMLCSDGRHCRCRALEPRLPLSWRANCSQMSRVIRRRYLCMLPCS